MDRSDMPITDRGDPVRVTRKASAMVRCPLKHMKLVYSYIRYAVKWCINTCRRLVCSKTYNITDTVNIMRLFSFHETKLKL